VHSESFALVSTNFPTTSGKVPKRIGPGVSHGLVRLAGIGGRGTVATCEGVVEQPETIRRQAATGTISGYFTDHLHGFIAVNGLDAGALDFESAGDFSVLAGDLLCLFGGALDSRSALDLAILGSSTMAAVIANSANAAAYKDRNKGKDKKFFHFIGFPV